MLNLIGQNDVQGQFCNSKAKTTSNDTVQASLLLPYYKLQNRKKYNKTKFLTKINHLYITELNDNSLMGMILKMMINNNDNNYNDNSNDNSKTNNNNDNSNSNNKDFNSN